jgi:hypothetical protein
MLVYWSQRIAEALCGPNAQAKQDEFPPPPHANPRLFRDVSREPAELCGAKLTCSRRMGTSEKRERGWERIARRFDLRYPRLLRVFLENVHAVPDIRGGNSTR